MDQINLKKIKTLLGIRNRFWRKKYEVLKPKLEELYFLSLKRNYFPLWISFCKTLLKRKSNSNSSELELYYYENLIKYLNKFKEKNLIIDKSQKAKIVKIKNTITIIIQNPDGSEDFEKRKKLQNISKKILTIIKTEPTIEKKTTYCKILSSSNLYLQEKDNFQELLESPIGKFLNTILPGFDLLIEIQQYKETLKEKEFLEILSDFTKKRIQTLISKISYSIFKNFPKQGKFFAYPIAILSGYAIERYESYLNCEKELEKNYSKILLIKRNME